MSIFSVRDGRKIQLVSYGSKHSLQYLSDKLFVHLYMHNLKTTGHTFSISTTALLSNTDLVWFRVAWDPTGELWPQKLNNHSLIHCLRKQQVYTLLFVVHVCITTKLTYLMIAYYKSKDGFTVNDALFMNTNLASYTSCCRVFQLMVYTNIKVSKR